MRSADRYVASERLKVRQWDVNRAAKGTEKHWCEGNAAVTHLLNAYTMLVPENEKFFIQTLMKVRSCLKCPELQERVKEFIYQEAQHGVGHRHAWQILERQGYRICGFVNFNKRWVFRSIGYLFPLPLKVSFVAAVEHINSYIAHEYLTRRILKDADAEMRALFEWHFAEEIEHKAVAFEVLKTYRLNYLLRIVGLLLVAPLFYLLAAWGAGLLMVQDRSWRQGRTWQGWWLHVGPGRHMFVRSLKHLARYLSPNFHPWHLDDMSQAKAAIERSSFVLVNASD